MGGFRVNISNFIEELKRRNVIKVATAYAIAGWLIIQVIDTISPQFGFPEWVPPFFTTLVLIGFPLALIFAWAFELTPEGIQKSKEVDITESVTISTGKKLNGIIITVLSMAVIFLLVERVFFAEAAFIENQSINIETASIAVLPFVNMSGDQENEYFSDGLSEELLNALAKVDEMKVAGRTSSFKFKGQNENLSLIGDELKVGHILEGSVRRSGDRVRITAQLIKVDDGYHMWSETYDRELTAENIFGIQEEISRKVLNELKVRLLPETEEQLSEIPTNDIEAYNIYLKGTQYEATRIAEDLELAIQQYKEAIRLDPGFAKAYARLAISYDLLALYGSIPNEEKEILIQSNVDQALFINENIPEAYAAQGLMNYSNGEYQKGIEALEKAIELNPNYGIAYTWLGNAHWRAGSPNKIVIDLYQKAYEIDPLNNVVNSNYARSLIFEDKPEEALEIFQARVKLEPKYLFSYYRIAEINMYQLGNTSKAFETMLEARKVDPDAALNYTQFSILASDAGFHDFAKELYKEAKENYPDNETLVIANEVIRYYDRDYEGLRDFVENDFMVNQGQEVFNEGLYRSVYGLELLENNFELTRKIIDRYYPEFYRGEFNLDEVRISFAVGLATLAKEDGNTQLLTSVTDAICEFAKEERNKLINNPQSNDYIFPQMFCYDLKGDKESYITTLDEYQEKINPMIIYFQLVESKEVWEFARQDMPEINRLKKMAEEHFLNEYKETVDILREYGEWNSNWSEIPQRAEEN
ncbi:MAG: hypothetical protein BalsKO_26650 [Balneolaceae bacterium]